MGGPHEGNEGKMQSLSSSSVVSSIKGQTKNEDRVKTNKEGRPWKTQSCHIVASELLENKYPQR